MSDSIDANAPSVSLNSQSFAEELANALTHGVGALLSVAGLSVLAVLATIHGGVYHVVGCSVFGSTLVLLYLASTLYHSIPHPRAKRVFQLLDHCAIYLLIAGSYTPFTLVTLGGRWGWSLFGIVWGLALVGIVLQATPTWQWEWLRITLYVAMGWTVLVASGPVMRALPLQALLLVFFGGLAYTVGIVFYCWRSLPYHHAVWHLFVLAGSALHFFAVLWYVIP